MSSSSSSSRRRGCRNGTKHGGGPDNNNGWNGFGGYMAAKQQKLDGQFSEDQPRNRELSGAASTIFHGVAIFVNGYTVPSSDELKRLMMVHGGRFVHYYRKTEVTHIIATNLPQAKIKKLNDEKVVRAEWILDSIQAGRLLSYVRYQLYGNRTTLQRSLSFRPKTSVTSDFTSYSTEVTATEVTATEVTATEVTATEVTATEVTAGSYDVLQFEESSSNDNGLKGDSKKTEDCDNLEKSVKHQATGTSAAKQDHHAGSLENKILQSPTINEKTFQVPAKAGDPKFVSEYYNHSRLHHISSWAAEFKELVMQLQSQGNGSFPARDAVRKAVEKQHQDIERHPMTSGVQNGDGSSSDDDSLFQTAPSGEEVDKRKIKSDSSRSKGHDGVIMHVDMDCFFVSVGLINRPELRGKPVAVTHSRGNGMRQVNSETTKYEQEYYKAKYGSSLSRVTPSGNQLTTPNVPSDTTVPAFNSYAEIASCSYEARAVGLRNGMFMGEAKKLCPDLQTIPYNFDQYKEVARKLYAIVASYTHDIEAVSCDEMFVDVSQILHSTRATPLEFAKFLREDIYKQTQCCASIGIAHNILLARMSTRVAKPNGQYYLETGQVMNFIKSQHVGDIPGVGMSLKRRLQALNVNTCGHLQLIPIAKLQKEFGEKTGQQLYNYSRGRDDRAIQVEKLRKSVSAEINYGIRFTKDSEAMKFVSEVAEEVHRRLLKIGMKGKTITLKLKVRKPDAPIECSKFLGHGICNNLAKSVTLGQATNDLKNIKEAVLNLLRQMNIQASDMRGVGIQIHKLVNSSSGDTQHSTASGTKTLKDYVTSVDVRNKSVDLNNIPGIIQLPIKRSNTKTLMSFVQKQPTKYIKATSRPDVNPGSELDIKNTRALPQLPSMAAPSMAAPSMSAPSMAAPSVAAPSMAAPSMAATSKAAPPMAAPSVAAPSMAAPSREEAFRKSDFYPVSMSDIDSSVLDALPLEIKQQIKNSFNNRPQGDQTNPLTSTPVQVKHRRVEELYDQPTTSRDVINLDQLHNSGGQNEVEMWSIDPSILKELPDDIVQELMTDQRKLQQKGQRMAAEPVEALPNLSQIEPSCLDALPLELKEELKCAYIQQSKTQHLKKNPTKLSSPKPSPAKNSPRKQSPFNKRRGRQKKGSPRKLFDKNQPKIFDIIKGSPNKQKEISDEVVGTRTNVEDDTDNVASFQSEIAQQLKKQNVQPIQRPSRANLNGAVELQDVKELLREWTETCELPRDDDLGHVITFLQELVLEKNLEKVEMLLKALRRYTNHIGTSEWQGAYTIAVNLVQDSISQVYNSRLKFV